MGSQGAAVVARLLADGHIITEPKLKAIGEALAGLSRASLDAIAPLYASLPALIEALLEPTVRLSEGLLSGIMGCLVWLVAVLRRQLVDEDLQAAGARDRAAAGLAALARLLSADSRVWLHCEGANTGKPAPLAKLAAEMAFENPSVVDAVLVAPQRPGGADLLEGALQFCLRMHALVKLAPEFASRAASAATVAINALPEAGPLKQANVLSLAETVQVLPQLAGPLHETQFARLQLVAAPRVALAAKALGSPTLTLRLWGVKDCARLLEKAHGHSTATALTAPRVLAYLLTHSLAHSLIHSLPLPLLLLPLLLTTAHYVLMATPHAEQAHSLPHSRGATGSEVAMEELAELFMAHALPQLLLGDLAHEEVHPHPHRDH